MIVLELVANELNVNADVPATKSYAFIPAQ
jgi:hypothetical protein